MNSYQGGSNGTEDQQQAAFSQLDLSGKLIIKVRFSSLSYCNPLIYFTVCT
jgi:hypothetical protein